MQHYSVVRTLLKGIAPLLGFSAGVAIVELLPESYDTLTQQWPEVVIGICTILAPIIQNIWKNRDKEGNPIRWFLPLGLCFLLGLSGCATTGSSLSESITDPETGEITTTSLKTKSMVTLWAEQQEGSGSASYDWSGEGGSLHVGQAAIGQSANMPLEQVLSAILPVLMNISAPRPQSTDPSFREQVLQFIRENPDIVSQAFYVEEGVEQPDVEE